MIHHGDCLEVGLRETLVTLVRIGFLVTRDGQRAVPDDIVGEPFRSTLLTILTAEDSKAAAAALAHAEPRDTK